MYHYVYVVIVALLLLLSIDNLFRESDWRKQLTNLIVIIPLILRTFLIK